MKTRKNKRFYEIVFIVAMLAIPLIHFCVFSCWIHIKTILMTFQTRDAVLNEYVFLKGDIFANYKEIIRAFLDSTGGLWPSVKNSVVLFLMNDFIMVPASLIMSYFFYKKIPMERFFRVVFYLPSIISVVVMIMVYRFMFDSTIGFVDSMLERLGLSAWIPEFGWFGTDRTAWAMVIGYCIWSGLGGNIVLFSGAMARVPYEVIESAHLDGVGFWGELWRIVLPLIGTTISTTLLLGVQTIFTYFLPVMLLTNGGPNNSTMVLPLYCTQLITSGAGDLSGSATLGIFISLIGTPIIIVSRILLDRSFPAYEY